jgi:nucleoside-diphosphate-sugar epimerase
MKVLVTGGIGAVGKAVVERLIHSGWDVRVIDRREGVELENAEYQRSDITNYADIREKVRGCDAVVHLAAIPNPLAVPAPELFHINVTGTYNVYEAAADEGIQRVVQASSINAFGCFWGTVEIAPNYFPIDEEHPTCTTDVYSFSKELVEDIAAYYWRRAGISGASFRFPGVWPQTFIDSGNVQQRAEQSRTLIDEFASQSEAERATRLAALRAATVDFRAKKHMEYPLGHGGIQREGFSDDPLFGAYAFERFNFWSYIDERDAAQGIDKALRAEYEGSHPLFINAKHNSLNYDSNALVNLFFPESQVWTAPLRGAETLVSNRKAHSLIGFDPEYSI